MCVAAVGSSLAGGMFVVGQSVFESAIDWNLDREVIVVFDEEYNAWMRPTKLGVMLGRGQQSLAR
jgi:hypothetical protein